MFASFACGEWKSPWSDHLKKYLKNKIPLCALVCALLLVTLMPATAFAAKDPLSVISNLSTFMFAVIKEELDSDTEALMAVGRKHLCQVATLRYQQSDGLHTALPYGVRRTNTLRTMTTESTAILMPFNTQEMLKGNIPALKVGNRYLLNVDAILPALQQALYCARDK